MLVKRVAVVGGGPKAAAIAAKAEALSRAGYSSPAIYVFEPSGLGAAWRGKMGYTDGMQPLCTLAERDVGFPYDRGSFGVQVVQEMMAAYSWPAYAVRCGKGETEYGEWVLRGRQPPLHSDFADYIEHVIQLSGARHIAGEVTVLDYIGGSQPWRVHWYEGGSVNSMDFDGVVITGSGTPLPHLPNGNERVFDGKSFWSQIPRVLSLINAVPYPSAVIIGAGGTGAAVAHWFSEHLGSVEVTIIGREATLYTRHAGYFEDRLFSDEESWSALPAHMRDEFISRLNSGVIWDYVMQSLAGANVKYECASVMGYRTLMTPLSMSGIPELAAELVEVSNPRVTTVSMGTPVVNRVVPATVLIDARGFDAWWFVSKFLNGTLQVHFNGNRAALENEATYSLCIGGPKFPRLHIPRLASRQGPGASNLMSLGWMADRILSEYIPLAEVAARTGNTTGDGRSFHVTL